MTLFIIYIILKNFKFLLFNDLFNLVVLRFRLFNIIKSSFFNFDANILYRFIYFFYKIYIYFNFVQKYVFNFFKFFTNLFIATIYHLIF